MLAGPMDDVDNAFIGLFRRFVKIDVNIVFRGIVKDHFLHGNHS
jgi:hypothetical protein